MSGGAAEHGAKAFDLVALAVIFREKFQAVVIAGAIANHGPEAQRGFSVRRGELDSDLVAEAQLEAGKDAHTALVEFGATTSDARGICGPMYYEADGYLEMKPVPTTGRGETGRARHKENTRTVRGKVVVTDVLVLSYLRRKAASERVLR